jgi:hypothetical protein
MKNLSEYTVGSYASLGMLVAFGIYLPFTEDKFSYLGLLNFSDHLVIIAAAISSMCVQVCRMKSTQHEEPAKVAVLNYF